MALYESTISHEELKHHLQPMLRNEAEEAILDLTRAGISREEAQRTVSYEYRFLDDDELIQAHSEPFAIVSKLQEEGVFDSGTEAAEFVAQELIAASKPTPHEGID